MAGAPTAMDRATPRMPMRRRVVCPEGLPCRVSCEGVGGCSGAKIFCPSEGSCEISCGAGSCQDLHPFCGSGRCKVHGEGGNWTDSRHYPYPRWEYSYLHDICAGSCDCEVPIPLTSQSVVTYPFPGSTCTPGASCKTVDCPCFDGELLRYQPSSCVAGRCRTKQEICTVACAAHAGWVPL